MISSTVATEIAVAYREIEVAEELLAQIDEAMRGRAEPDIRDAFGRRRGGLELGVPSGGNSRRLFNVPWPLARPIIAAHIAEQRALIAALSEQALSEAKAGGPT